MQLLFPELRFAQAPLLQNAIAYRKMKLMNTFPYLLFKGQRFTVDRPIFIGRDESCDIMIDSATLSRRHACVVDSRAGCTLIDMNSRNGTFLNGEDVKADILSSGDIITLGDFQIHFQIEEQEGISKEVVFSRGSENEDDLLLRALQEDTLELLRKGLLKDNTPANQLLILYKIAKSINECPHIEELMGKLVALTSEVMRADRCLLILKESDGNLRARYFEGFEEAKASKIPEYSRSIAMHCFSQSKPLFINSAQQDERFCFAESVSRFNIGTAMAAPLVHRGEKLGVLYLDQRIERSSFSPKNLNLLAALAEQATVALTNAKLYRELKNSLERIERQQEALVQSEKLAAMGVLSAGVSHEIRNPITVISGNVEVLMSSGRERSREERHRMLEAIDRAAKQVFSVIDGLLDFSKKRPRNDEQLDLNDVLKETVDMVQSTLMKAFDFKLRLDLCSRKLLIFGDKREMIQVFMNLIINSVQAMKDGGILTIATVFDGKNYRISFLDTGPGIANEDLEEIFQPFYTNKNEGTGLGLWISRRIIEERMKGRLDAANRETKGAHFWIDIPIP